MPEVLFADCQNYCAEELPLVSERLTAASGLMAAPSIKFWIPEMIRFSPASKPEIT
jgi:hypothetical protein